MERFEVCLCLDSDLKIIDLHGCHQTGLYTDELGIIMDNEQQQKFKEQLEQMKVDLLSDVEQTLTDMTEQSGNIPDANDRATVESDRGFELRLRGRERKLLEKIDHAIARIEQGTYGICVECGNEIRPKRLDARPVAKFCIDCKIEQEQQEKAQGR